VTPGPFGISRVDRRPSSAAGRRFYAGGRPEASCSRMTQGESPPWLFLFPIRRTEIDERSYSLSLSEGERAGERILLINSCFEPLNLIVLRSSVVVRSVAALPFGASRFARLPAGEIGSGRLHMHCLATPPVRCSRWGGLSLE